MMNAETTISLPDDTVARMQMLNQMHNQMIGKSSSPASPDGLQARAHEVMQKLRRDRRGGQFVGKRFRD